MTFQIDHRFEGLARARGEIHLTREFAIKFNLDLLKKMHTSCPTQNQPAEKLTVPGSILSVDVFATKLSLCTRQLGVLSKSGKSFLTEARERQL